MSDAESTLRCLLNSIVDENGYKNPEIKIKAITSGGANYTSGLFLSTITSPDRDTLHLFAKVAIVGDKMRVVMNADWMYGNERFFYLKLVKIYEDIQNKFGLLDEQKFHYPRFYGCNPNFGEETIVLEDLVADGYGTYDRFKSVDWEHAASAMEELAKFHAMSFAFEKEYPEQFKEVIEQLQFKAVEDTEHLRDVWIKMIGGALEVIKAEDRQKVLNFFEKEDGNKLFKKYNMPIGRPVLIHGDFRPSNLLIRKKGEKIETTTVDFQTVHAGCPVSDLVYFLFIGSDEDFRATHYRKIVEHYYDSLKESLRRLDILIDDVYPRREFESNLKEMLPYALLIGVSVLPIVTVEAEDAPRVDGDADVSDFIMKPNRHFASRFRGIVNDCLKWGVI